MYIPQPTHTPTPIHPFPPLPPPLSPPLSLPSHTPSHTNVQVDLIASQKGLGRRAGDSGFELSEERGGGCVKIKVVDLSNQEAGGGGGGGEELIEADFVVVTLPLGVLKANSGTPHFFRKNKTKQIQNTLY